MLLALCKSTSGEELFIIPVVRVVLEGSVEWGKPSFDDELPGDLLVPVTGSGIDPMRGKKSKVDCLVLCLA